MVKVFTILLALLIALSFSGMTFAKSLGASSDQISIQVPQGGDTKDDTKDDETKGDEPKMEDEKGGDEDKDKDKE